MKSTKLMALVIGVALGISLAVAVVLTYAEMGIMDLSQTVEAAKSGGNSASQMIGQSQHSDGGGNSASQMIGQSQRR